ncbi:hypothetical protein [Xanthomonas vasicola]|nr:hypothetical protein [Xanthomonas vasicola]MDO6986204.1 hypothetical protein [Xanthomonas vasicola]
MAGALENHGTERLRTNRIAQDAGVGVSQRYHSFVGKNAGIVEL